MVRAASSWDPAEEERIKIVRLRRFAEDMLREHDERVALGEERWRRKVRRDGGYEYGGNIEKDHVESQWFNMNTLRRIVDGLNGFAFDRASKMARNKGRVDGMYIPCLRRSEGDRDERTFVDGWSC
jgi:hypothetical protein